MPKLKSSITAHKKRLRKVNIQIPSEVSVEDVVKHMLGLFDRIGIDARAIAAQASNVKQRKLAGSRVYPHVAAISEILTSWHRDAAYLDEAGNPAPIKMQSARRSFRLLARRCVPDKDPKSLLAEMVRVGAVTIDELGLIRANTRSLPVYQDKQFAIQHTLTSLDSFIKTLQHNLKSSRTNSHQLFHRIARNGDFNPRELPALKIKVKRQGQGFLESCDDWMARRSVQPTGKGRSSPRPVQVSIGVYLSVDKT